jgi:hypothetical protein
LTLRATNRLRKLVSLSKEIFDILLGLSEIIAVRFVKEI